MVINEGEFKGIHVYPEYDPQTDSIIVKLLSQVGFRNGNGDFQYFKVNDLPTKENLLDLGYDFQSPTSMIILAGNPENEWPTIIEELSKKGFDAFKKEGEGIVHHTNEQIQCEVSRVVDDKLGRAIAKIAFNYLAYWTPVDFTLHSAFDDIRTFIRLGVKPDYRYIWLSDDAILVDEEPDRRIHGHIVTTNWTKDGHSIIAQVTLSNMIVYNVILAVDYKGIRIPITNGHLFALGSQRILRLGTNNKPVFPGLIIARHSPLLILPKRFRKEL